MKSELASLTLLILATAVASGCATSNPIPAGMKAGQFVAYECDGGKRFQARAAEDGSSVRIRYEGGYELDHVGKGVYEGSGWKLTAAGSGPAELQHNGKPLLTACKLS